MAGVGVWTRAGVPGSPWPNAGIDETLDCESLDAPCAAATDAPMTRPAAASAKALSHLHMRKDPGNSSASPVRS